MTIQDAINGFKKDIKLLEGSEYDTVIERFNIAIRSLEAWDKLREEIQTEDPHCCKYTDEYGMVIPLDYLISAIDSYLQEVEE